MKHFLAFNLTQSIIGLPPFLSFSWFKCHEELSLLAGYGKGGDSSVA